VRMERSPVPRSGPTSFRLLDGDPGAARAPLGTAVHDAVVAPLASVVSRVSPSVVLIPSKPDLPCTTSV
jgi:hypothetical protein